MSTWRRVVDDPRTWAAIDQLLERGLCEDYVFPLLQHLSALPDMWTKLDREAQETKDDRRRILAHKIRAFSFELDADPEVKYDRVFDHESITTSVANRPTLSEFLRRYAGYLECRSNPSSAYDKHLKGKKTTRNDLSSFVCREIVILLREHLPPQKTNPVSATSKLASVLLSETITKDKIKATYRRL